MASEGPMGKGATYIVTSFSFGATDIVAVGESQALFGAGPKGRAHQSSTVGEGASEEGGANSLASLTPADMRSTNKLKGVLTMANSSSWSPSHSRWDA